MIATTLSLENQWRVGVALGSSAIIPVKLVDELGRRVLVGLKRSSLLEILAIRSPLRFSRLHMELGHRYALMR